MSNQSSAILETRNTPVMGEYDVVVLGGGPSGIAAAAAAGRSGRSTILIERYGFLGGLRHGCQHLRFLRPACQCAWGAPPGDPRHCR